MTGAILPVEEVKKRVAQLQADGKSVVFTAGFFDIPQLPHVELLEKAKEKGDVLVVGVFSDKFHSESHATHPLVYPCKDRMAILSTLSMPDLIFELTTSPLEIFQSGFRPDTFAASWEFPFNQKQINIPLDKMSATSISLTYAPRDIVAEVIKKYSNEPE